MRRLLLICCAILVPSIVHAHARWVWPTPRDDNSGIKFGPCGDVPRGSTPARIVAGETIEMQFEETINHPGWFRIALGDENDQGFDQNVLLDMIPHSEEGVPSYENPRPYTANVTIPNRTCERCTLQLIQVMTDKSMIGGMYQMYFSCADVTILPEGSVGDRPGVKPAEDAGGCRCFGAPREGALLGLLALIACLRPARRRS